MTFLLLIIIVLALSNLLLFSMLGIYIMRSLRAKKTYMENQALLEEQKFKMAEASLKLLEQREELEEQKLKLADANIKLLESNEIIEQERQRSEKLLLNILPKKIADELKENGSAKPECFENVTVMFSDIVDFTHISEKMEPAVLINELNELFTAFDRIARAYSCERIKTIGDAYLCVCGMPEKNDLHAENILNTALQILDHLKKRNEKSPFKWQIRIGIHSGKVVGGVVGTEKYIYDVFGDTINTTSRMESNSEPMKINVSSETFALAKDKFRFEERPSREIKGKGTSKMYFVLAG